MKKQVYIPVAVLLAVLLMTIPSLIQTQEHAQPQLPVDTPEEIIVTDPDFLFLGRRYGDENELGKINGTRLPVTQTKDDGTVIEGFMEVAYIASNDMYYLDDYNKVILLDRQSKPISYPIKTGSDNLHDTLYYHCNSSSIRIQGEMYQYTAWNGEKFLTLRVDPEVYSVQDNPKPLDISQLETRVHYDSLENGVIFNIRNLSEDQITINSNVEFTKIIDGDWIPYEFEDINNGFYFDPEYLVHPGSTWYVFYNIYYMEPGEYMVATTVSHPGKTEVPVETTFTIEDNFDYGLAQKIKENTVNQFAFDYFQEISNDSENIVFSPYCMSTLFSILYEGARDGTAEEIREVFHLNNDTSVNRALLNMYGDEYINSVNGVWVQQDYSIKQEFMEIMLTDYEAETENVDFNEPEPVRIRVNKWIANQTNGLIEELFPPNSFSILTRLVAANTLYFKDDWAYQFEAYDTKQMDFHVLPNETIKVDTMAMSSRRFNYTQTDSVQVLEMPYENSGFSMVILLPINHTLPELESGLTTEELGEYIGGLKETPLKLYIPKFEYKNNYDLKQILPEMGMPSAFDDADFTGISEAGRLFLSNAYHETFIRVDEKGTEVAAATGGAMLLGGGISGGEFRADHPFLYLIMDKETGSILFMGRVNDPTQ